MTSLSILIVVHNEEKQLESCLKTISFGNELVVILDKCTDKSKQIELKGKENDYLDQIRDASIAPIIYQKKT